MSLADVVVSRSALRGMRTLVAGICAGLLVLVGGVVLLAVDAKERCEAGNDLRRVDLPAAFHEYGVFLGDEFGAAPADVEAANARFAVQLDGLFPERDCSLW